MTGTDLGFELALGGESASRTGLARTGSAPWDGRAKCILLSQGLRARARESVYARVHLCACVHMAARVQGRRRAHAAPTQAAARPWGPLHFQVPQTRARGGRSAERASEPSERGAEAALEVGPGEGTGGRGGRAEEDPGSSGVI